MSNLLDKSSIVLTASAYNNGKVLCVKPSDGSGDFDFSRNSAATRVNAQGLVEDVQILSSNLVQNGDFSQLGSQEITNGNFSQQGSQLITNGDFATDSNWTLISGVTYNVGGYLDFDGSQGTGSVTNTPNTTFTLNKTYKVVYEIKNYISGTIKFRFQGGSNTIGQQKSGDGVKTEYIVCNDSSNNKFNFFGSSSFNGSIDNVSVVEVGQDWTIASGSGWSIGEDKIIGVNSLNFSAYQASLVSGKTYKITYEVKDYVSGTFGIRANTAAGLTVTANGVYTDYITSNGNKVYLMGFGTFNGSVTNISVKEVGQDWNISIGDTAFGDNVVIFPTSTSSFLIQSNAVDLSVKNYKLQYKVVTTNGSNLRLSGGNSAFGTFNLDSATTGVKTAYLTSNGTKRNLQINNNAFIGSVTNISIIEITDDTNLPRINYEGFSFQDALGSEQVTNGDFSNGVADWGAGGGANISVANNQLTIEADNDFNFYARQTVSGFIVGKQYKLTIDVAGGTTSKINVGVFGEGVLINNQPIVIGKQSVIFTLTNGSDGTRFLDINNRNDDGVNDTLIINSVSVKEYKGQEVVPDSGCGNWLWEPQSTNLIPYSEDFTQWASLGGTVTYVSDLVNPDGSLGGYKISGSGIYLALNLLSTTERNIYARTVSGTGTAQLLSHNTNTNNAFSLTEDWKRFDINSSPASAVANFYIDLRGAASTLTELYVWGANATNDQDYPTSYIPADGTSVTRNQDACTNGGSLASINSTSGVLYAEIAALANENVQRVLSLSDGTHNNTVKLGFLNSATDYRLFADIRLGGVNQAFLTFNFGAVAPTFKKCAIKYKQNDFALWIDGVEVATDTSGNTFSANTLNELTFTRGDAAQNFFGETKCLAVWKEALTDTQLAELTTI